MSTRAPEKAAVADIVDQQQDPISFSFGQNWQSFIEKHYSEDRVKEAREHLLGFLEMSDLSGKYFLDIGCGSGIHSLAAFQSGADRVVSFDLDPYSVATTRKIREMHGSPSNWTVMQGSILDPQFVSTVEPADIVYSWGVLHHTGQMWKAIENAATRLKDRNSLFYIALYVTGPKSPYWIDVKKRYNRASDFGKRMMEARYIFREVLVYRTLHGQNPIKFIRNYGGRGMDFMTDVKDWLGGYPYEDASVEEVVRFGRKKLGMNTINLDIGPGLAEYLLEKR